jgi:hypothetical protein
MLPQSCTDSADDFNWQELFGEASSYAGMPTSYSPQEFTFPPSPIYSDKQSPVEPSLQFDDYITQPSTITPAVAMPVSKSVAVRSPSTDDTPGYPSPSSSNAFFEASPSPQIKVEPQSFSPSNLPPRRRGPGRPSKAQLAAEGIHGKRGRSSVGLRREIHNDSAMRSRARFNTVLDQLWAVVPENERQDMPDCDGTRSVCRAEKIEIVIAYVKKLQRQAERRNCY